jgi:vanillate O-demethylase monooxygenase subunit
MIEGVQTRMGDRELLSMRPILLATDAAAIRARRLLAAMIEAEARVHEPAPAAVA